jgi:hypothetical protein
MFRAGKREVDPGAQDVETLMDDRVRRIIASEKDRDARVSPDDLRRLAEARLAALGADGRFASGLHLAPYLQKTQQGGRSCARTEHRRWDARFGVLGHLFAWPQDW